MDAKNAITATRLIQFDAGHRVMNHESKCATLHGHRYVLEITAKSDELDSIGRVIDFSILKERIGNWVDSFWDHTTLVCSSDQATIKALMSMPRYKDPFICDFNPTAENMAEYLLKTVCPKLLKGTGVIVSKIKLWETPNCFAEVEL